MSNTDLPTKSNLMKNQNSLKVTKQGHDLLEQKRIILTKELEKYIGKENDLKKELYDLVEEGKNLIQAVNTDIGMEKFINIANGVKIDEYIDIKNMSLMGVEIPSIVHNKEIPVRNYGFFNTTHNVDLTMLKFNQIQEKLIELAVLSNTIIRLKREVQRVRERSSALSNIIIPEYQQNIRRISDILDEREREEFARLKVIKKKII